MKPHPSKTYSNDEALSEKFLDGGEFLPPSTVATAPEPPEPLVTWIPIGEVKTSEPFVSSFPIYTEILEGIKGRMKIEKFDPNQPLIIWKEEGILIDGHTRLKAAKAVGLTEVAISLRSFPSERLAFDYAILNNRDRRKNLKDGDFLRLVEIHDNRRKRRGGPEKSGGQIKITVS